MNESLIKIKNQCQNLLADIEALEDQTLPPSQKPALLSGLNVHAEQIGALTRELVRLQSSHRVGNLPVPPTESPQRKRFPYQPRMAQPSQPKAEGHPPTTKP